MPTAQWSDQYVAPVLLIQVVLLLREPAPTTATLRAAATSRTDVAASQTRIALSWRRLCRTISLPSARTMSVSRAAGAMFSQFWRRELNLIGLTYQTKNNLKNLTDYMKIIKYMMISANRKICGKYWRLQHLIFAGQTQLAWVGTSSAWTQAWTCASPFNALCFQTRLYNMFHYIFIAHMIDERTVFEIIFAGSPSWRLIMS